VTAASRGGRTLILPLATTAAPLVGPPLPADFVPLLEIPHGRAALAAKPALAHELANPFEDSGPREEVPARTLDEVWPRTPGATLPLPTRPSHGPRRAAGETMNP
jgi:hypothetical protein